MEYYFLASLLPQLEIGHLPALGFQEFKQFLAINLLPKDMKKVQQFLRLLDIENFRSIWASEPLDWRGNLKKEQLQQALEEFCWPDGEEFPDYLRDFLEKNSTSEERLAKFSLLMSRFLEEEGERATGFLADYFLFEREWRLVMVGFRAKSLGKNVEAELLYEDPTDPMIAQIIAQKDAKTYEPPFEYKELKPLFEAFAHSPLELHKALCEYRFDQFQELFGQEIFSLDRLLGYMAQLQLVEKWLELDVQKGIEIIDRIEEGVVR